MIRQGYVNLSCDDGKCLLTVRVDKVRTAGDKSEVVGRDAELERMILTELNAQPIQKERRRQRFRGAGSERIVNSNPAPVTLSTSFNCPSTRRQPRAPLSLGFS